VANLANLDGLFAQIKREKGGLDIVFANAGFSKWGPLGEITEEDYDSLFNGNVKGLLFTVQKAVLRKSDCREQRNPSHPSRIQSAI
jgi:NAD(P)-dependent dehydrogenase (short-subunit alcohol dehydrogenase family)